VLAVLRHGEGVYPFGLKIASRIVFIFPYEGFSGPYGLIENYTKPSGFTRFAKR
jgi:hypothetical protein